MAWAQPCVPRGPLSGIAVGSKVLIYVDHLTAKFAACPVWSDQQAGAPRVSSHLRHLPLQDTDPGAGEGRPHKVLAFSHTCQW